MIKNTLTKILLTCVVTILCTAQYSFAQSESDIDFQNGPLYKKATVQDIIQTTYPLIFGKEVEFQQLSVQFEDGTKNLDVYNDYTPVQVGDVVYITAGYNPDTNTEGYFVREIDRANSIVGIALIFIAVYLLIAGVRGFRSLIALAFAVASVWFILIPLLVAGYDPLLVGVGLSTLILGIAIFVTHGLSIVSVASYVGSMIAICFTIIFANLSVSWARISGLVGDENSTLSILYGSSLDLQGLLLAGMIIGILGVLDDVAVMQAAMVREFMYESKKSIGSIFKQAMRVGQEHAAALVNTLVLAYTAVALPLFLIVLSPTNQQFETADIPLRMQLSNELFVAELIRSVVGSFGLVITIPIVTALAIVLFMKFPPKEPGAHHVHHH